MLATSISYAQKNTNPDDTFIPDPALRDYLDKTPYQHGSLHGYEDGYQTGDIDFHLQRPQPDFTKVKEYRSATRGYVDGDKEQFRSGYRDGYQLGYEDAKEGRAFVAIERLQAARKVNQSRSQLRRPTPISLSSRLSRRLASRSKCRWQRSSRPSWRCLSHLQKLRQKSQLWRRS